MEKGRLISQGRTAEVYEWGTDRILKLFRQGIPEMLIQNEYEVSRSVSDYISIVPRVYEMVKDDGRPGIIYERVSGLTMMKIIGSKPWKAKAEGIRMAELHKRIQIKADNGLPDCKERLKINIKRADMLSDDIKERLYGYIDALEDGNVICHGDFHPDNIMLSEKGETIIDWMTASSGSPLADVARTSVMFKYAEIPANNIFEKLIVNIIRKKFFSEYLRHYLSITGTDIKQIEKWEIPIAAARLTEWLPPKEKKVLLNFVESQLYR